MGYLKRLQILSVLLNRKCIFPPAWICLKKEHHHTNIPSKFNWDAYINTSKIQNLEMQPPFSFENNGDISTKLSKVYYPNGYPIDKIDNTYDIIIFVNFKSSFSNIYDYLKINKRLNNVEKKNISYINPYEKYPTSNILKKYTDEIISNLDLVDFTFLHIRRVCFS